MAMYEKEGYRPGNAFNYYLYAMKASPTAEIVVDILDNRKNYMIYDSNCQGWGYQKPSVIDALLGGRDGNLGIEVANYLEKLIPNCKYAIRGKEILIRDVVTPYAMDDDVCHHIWEEDPIKEWCFYDDDGLSDPEDPVTIKEDKAIFCDSRFVICIKNTEKAVLMYIFKYPKD